jgi:hypothetical protein
MIVLGLSFLLVFVAVNTPSLSDSARWSLILLAVAADILAALHYRWAP